jgi:starch synthase
MIFFTKGVVETVKKLNWSPDIIHLHGWFTALFPLYLQTYYKDEPLFSESKIISSIYGPDFETPFAKNFFEKVAFDKIDKSQLEELKTANYDALISLAIKHSDGLILSAENVPVEVVKEVEKSKKPHLKFNDSKNEEVYIDFYSNKI